MKRPDFLEGTGVAFAAALAAGLVHPALHWLFSAGEAPRLLLTALSFAYLIYVLIRSPERVGRFVSLGAWLLVTGSLWVLETSLPAQVLSHLALLSLLRSLYFHGAPMAAIADLGLTGLALIAGLGAYLHTGSVFLTVWCLFLVQALWVSIPSGTEGKRRGPREDPFERAHRTAEAALRKLATPGRS